MNSIDCIHVFETSIRKNLIGSTHIYKCVLRKPKTKQKSNKKYKKSINIKII